MSSPANPFALADWRRRVAAEYAAVRSGVADLEGAAKRFRAARDRLFSEHPESPIAEERRRDWRGRLVSVCAGVAAEGRRRSRDQAGDVRDSAGGRRDPALHARRRGALHRGRTASAPGRLLARRLWWRTLAAVFRHDQRRRHLWRRSLSLRHDQRRRPWRERARNPARLQLRVQPIVRVRRSLVVPAVAPREPLAVRGFRGRTLGVRARAVNLPAPRGQASTRPKNGYCGSE